MFSNEPRCRYGKNQLGEVICQLRFPEILSIETTVPAVFQEAIGQGFPLYTCRRDAPIPRLVGQPGQMRIDRPSPTNNYQFMSEDGVWRVNLTSSFISLACTCYTCWEDFAQKLDKPLASFIQIYHPMFFERVGLRYLNFISKKALGMEDLPFRVMMKPQYLGLLADKELPESAAARSTMDAEFSLPGNCRVKIHAGPGHVKRNGIDSREVHFIFDQDLFMTGKLPVNVSAAALETLHRHANSIFRGAITDTLHNAMEPTNL